MDGPQSVVFDEAENRLHAQKGLLAWCLHADALNPIVLTRHGYIAVKGWGLVCRRRRGWA
jgi:hypothetical protein